MTSDAHLRSRPLRVVIAPDSFKGTVAATDAARLIAEGWLTERGGDTVTMLPQADGGEGTLDALAAGEPRARRHRVGDVCGPDGRPTVGEWLELPGRVAVVEVAQMAGLPLMEHLDALGASTIGLGQVIVDALDAGMRRVVVGAGGSASTDGGAGAFSALGLELLDDTGMAIGPGGGGLARLAQVGRRSLRVAPVEGVVVLADVDSPLLGTNGAAAVFGPQKGAAPADIDMLDAALATFSGLVGGDPDARGAGAAGGAAYGFAAIWNATIESGSAFVAAATRLDEAIATADVVITGEGRFDPTSFAGKVVGRTLSRAAAAGAATVVIAGAVSIESDGATYSLTEIAGSPAAAMADASAHLIEAGRRAARATTASHRR